MFGMIANLTFVKNYIYSIKELKEIVSVILKNINHLTILRSSNNYIRKIDLYKKEVEYGSI